MMKEGFHDNPGGILQSIPTKKAKVFDLLTTDINVRFIAQSFQFLLTSC